MISGESAVIIIGWAGFIVLFIWVAHVAEKYDQWNDVGMPWDRTDMPTDMPSKPSKPSGAAKAVVDLMDWMEERLTKGE